LKLAETRIEGRSTSSARARVASEAFVPGQVDGLAPVEVSFNVGRLLMSDGYAPSAANATAALNYARER